MTDASGRRPGRAFFWGLLIGFLAGTLWWTALMIAFGPSAIVTHDSAGWHEEPISVLQRVVYAPLMAIPWGIVGGIAGLLISLMDGGWLEATVCLLGTLGGLIYALLDSPFDGWLALTMPINAFLGTIVGLVLAGVARMARTFS